MELFTGGQVEAVGFEAEKVPIVVLEAAEFEPANVETTEFGETIVVVEKAEVVKDDVRRISIFD